MTSLRPWQLPGWELPHHALPLHGDVWRAPAVGNCDELAAIGLTLLDQRPDGSGAYRIHWQRLAEHFAAWSASDYAELGVGSSAWVAARVHLGAHAWLQFPPQPEWMVILNLTPDSFSDGGSWLDQQDQLQSAPLLQQAQQALNNGAKWLDLGAESTRPGADEIPTEQQLQRLLPAVELLLPLAQKAKAGISIDTRNASVAKACLEAGASMINDVSGFADPQMPQVCAEFNCPTVLMHMRGTPATMQEHCNYEDLIGQIADEMIASAAKGISAGLAPDRVTLDPGIGFSKTAEQNYDLIAHSDAFRALGFPLLLGPSRKSFLGSMFPDLAASDRDGASAGAAAICAQNGAQILRLHSGQHWHGILVAAKLGMTKMKHAHPYNA